VGRRVEGEEEVEEPRRQWVIKIKVERMILGRGIRLVDQILVRVEVERGTRESDNLMIK